MKPEPPEIHVTSYADVVKINQGDQVILMRPKQAQSMAEAFDNFAAVLRRAGKNAAEQQAWMENRNRILP